jgi:hypothetical protein
VRGERHGREPAVEAARRCRAEGLRRIFFLGCAPHQFYPESPSRNGEGPAPTRRCAPNRRELSKVEGLVGEKPVQGRFRYPAACILRLALICTENSIRAATCQREVLNTAHRGPRLRDTGRDGLFVGSAFRLFSPRRISAPHKRRAKIITLQQRLNRAITTACVVRET